MDIVEWIVDHLFCEACRELWKWACALGHTKGLWSHQWLITISKLITSWGCLKLNPSSWQDDGFPTEPRTPMTLTHKGHTGLRIPDHVTMMMDFWIGTRPMTGSHQSWFGIFNPVCPCARSVRVLCVLGLAGKLSPCQDDGFNFKHPQEARTSLLMVISH